MRALLANAYAFAFRESELLKLRVKQVDLLNRSIRLNVGETKSGEGRVFKLTDDTYLLLQASISAKQSEDYVSARENGKPVRDFRDRGAKGGTRSPMGFPARS